MISSDKNTFQTTHAGDELHLVQCDRSNHPTVIFWEEMEVI